MKTHATRFAHKLIGLAGAAALMLSACSSADADRANRAAEVILTRTSGGTAETADATSGVPSAVVVATAATADGATPGPGSGTTEVPSGPVTATPSLVYARCLAREASDLRREPSASAQVVVQLAARDIFTAYGRTIDAQWVLGWKNVSDFGWASAANTACTVPIPELMPAEPNALLLTPVVVAAAGTPTSAAADTTPLPSPAPLTDTPAPAPAQATLAPTDATTMAATDVPPANADLPTTTSTATARVAMLVTVAPALPQTETSAPTAAPSLPTQLPTPTATEAAPTTAPTPVPADAATVSTPPLVVTQVQMVTVVVTVTVTPNAPTATPTPLVVSQLTCAVTPGTPVNFRRGPARTERLIGTLTAGTAFVAQGRNEDGTWLFGLGPQNTAGWLIESSVACNGETAELPVVDR